MAALSFGDALALHSATYDADELRAREALQGYTPYPGSLPMSEADITTVAHGGTLPSNQSQPFPTMRLFFNLARDANAGREIPAELAHVVGSLLLQLGINYTDPATLTVAPVTVKESGYCHNAERYFRYTHNQISGGTGGLFQERVTVYCTPNGKPVALGKAKEYPSAITLWAMQAGHLCIPAGTLVTFPDGATYAPRGVPFIQRTPAGESVLQVCEVPDREIPLSIGRLSAFAFSDPSLRPFIGFDNGTRNGIGWGYADLDQSNENARFGVEDFCEAAQNLMSQCGA